MQFNFNSLKPTHTRPLDAFLVSLQIGTSKLPKDRTFIRNGNITLTNLRKEDFGRYECIVKNEIATLVAHTALRINGQ